MSRQKRWICHTCHREWAYDPSTLTIGVRWDGETCWYPGCDSKDIEHVAFTAPFLGGDWHDTQPPLPEPPDLRPPDLLTIAENRTLPLVQPDDNFDYGTS